MNGNLYSPFIYPWEITEQVAEQGKVKSFLVLKKLWQTFPLSGNEMNKKATIREVILIQVLIHLSTSWLVGKGNLRPVIGFKQPGLIHNNLFSPNRSKLPPRGRPHPYAVTAILIITIKNNNNNNNKNNNRNILSAHLKISMRLQYIIIITVTIITIKIKMNKLQRYHWSLIRRWRWKR